MEEITGTLAAITWRAEDDSAIIGRLRMPNGGTVAVKGPSGTPPMACEVTYKLSGKWDNHPKYGRQFEFAAASPRPPEDRKGVIAYLTSLCDGIGTKRAERLWDRYGPLAVQTLRQSPETVAESGICSLDVAREAAHALDHSVRYEAVTVGLLGLLHGRGFRLQPLLRVAIRRWGTRAPELLRRNPYLLLSLPDVGAGWKRTDKLYCDLGHPKDRLKRQALVAAQALRDARGGDTWHAADWVADQIVKAVGANAKPLQAFRLALRGRLLAITRIGDERWLALAEAAHAEAFVAIKVKELSRWTNMTDPSWRRLLNVSDGRTWSDTGTPDSPSPTGTKTPDEAESDLVASP